MLKEARIIRDFGPRPWEIEPYLKQGGYEALKSCATKWPDQTKVLKAEIRLSKTGSISNIKVTPSAAEADLAKCLRKKIGTNKVLRPKNKAVAQITVQFKIK